MSHDNIGPKLQQIRDLAARKFAPKQSTTELRKNIAKIKAVKPNKNRRGR